MLGRPRGVQPDVRLNDGDGRVGWVALKDRAAYRAWILEALERERPTELWMSHGETVTREDLPEVLAELVKRRT